MTKERVNEIDLLRFLAALSVVFYHYAFRGYAADEMTIMPYPFLSPLPKYGYLGVNLFFMISGFVILMTASDGNLKGFIASRFARLYPAFWMSCTLTFLITLLIGGNKYSATLSQYLINMTMLSGFVGIPPIDGVYWTLFIEIQFYLFVTLVLIFGNINKIQIYLALWLFITILLIAIHNSVIRSTFIYSYSAYFISGAILFLIRKNGLSIVRAIILLISWILALYQSSKITLSRTEYYHSEINNYSVSIIISTFFIALLLISLRKTGFISRLRWQLLGVITYPLYLLHENIGFMMFNATYPFLNPHLIFWATLTLMIAASYLVHIIIERNLSPFLKNGMLTLLDLVQRRFDHFKTYVTIHH